ncbi:ACP S-malonyltransferase [Streptomyces sp. NPDC006512]|uniref:ACP S-malonyltransferase n=1 Tax=Streptomyces sp. NPDC006512 TaxID=3154307 RepID=UPI0033BAF195
MDRMSVGLVFPGQGTQKEGMGAVWRDTPSWKITEEVSDVTGEDLPRLLLDTPGEQLRRTDLAQLTVFTLTLVAHAEAVRRGAFEGQRVVACAGHSLGEYAALTVAGALPAAAAAGLVAARGRAMREAAEQRPGTMGVLVAAPLEAVTGLAEQLRTAGHEVWVANVNAPGQTVVAGSADGIDRIEAEAPSIGAKMIRPVVGGAFHSPFMAPAAQRLRAALERTAFAPAHLPVVANVDARAHTGGDWAGRATRQLTSPVLWEPSVHTLVGPLGCRRLIEIGPGRTLAGLIRRIAPDVEAVSLDSPGALA